MTEECKASAEKNSSANRLIGRSALLVSVMTLGSRIFGLLRDVCMAWYWGGTGDNQAAFQVAFAIPNSLRALFSEGAFNQAFVPLFSEKLQKEGRENAWQMAEKVITLQLLALFICVAAVSSVSIFTLFFAAEKLPLRVFLTLRILPILMPYALFICLTGVFSAVLNSLQKFLLPAFAPIIFNIIQISAILVLAITWSKDDYAALYFFSLAATLSGMLQLIFMMIAARRQGMLFHFNFSWSCPDVRLLCINMAPALVGAGVMQLNSLVDRGLGLYLGSAAVGALTYSQRLVYLPVGIFAVALSVVCLPAMARAWAKNDEEEMNSSFNYALNMVLFLSLPCVALLAALGKETVTVLFMRGAFTAEAVQETCWALYFYLLGLPAFCCAKIATNPFHARKDTKTPVKAALICMVLNLCLNIILMQFLRQGGLALSTSICSWLNVFLLISWNARIMKGWKVGALLKNSLQFFIAALIAGFCAWALSLTIKSFLMNKGLSSLTSLNLFGLAGGACAGAMSYLLVNYFLGKENSIGMLKALLRK